jgi:hypothetical protein
LNDREGIIEARRDVYDAVPARLGSALDARENNHLEKINQHLDFILRHKRGDAEYAAAGRKAIADHKASLSAHLSQIQNSNTMAGGKCQDGFYRFQDQSLRHSSRGHRPRLRFPKLHLPCKGNPTRTLKHFSLPFQGAGIFLRIIRGRYPRLLWLRPLAFRSASCPNSQRIETIRAPGRQIDLLK